jgi:hypothetical protein
VCLFLDARHKELTKYCSAIGRDRTSLTLSGCAREGRIAVRSAWRPGDCSLGNFKGNKFQPRPI